MQNISNEIIAETLGANFHRNNYINVNHENSKTDSPTNYNYRNLD